MSLARPLIVIAFIAATAATPAVAADVTTTKRAPATSAWSATPHLGYGVNGQSTTGFSGVAGSLAFLDLSRAFSSGSYDLGLRSLAQGGRSGDGEFYRMGAGPLLAVKVADNWSAQLALQAFSETGLDAAGEKAYRSRGHLVMLGWERVFPVAPRVDIVWGGFVARHQGDVDPAAHLGGLATAGASRVGGATQNVGLSRGLEIGIRLRP